MAARPCLVGQVVVAAEWAALSKAEQEAAWPALLDPQVAVVMGAPVFAHGQTRCAILAPKITPGVCPCLLRVAPIDLATVWFAQFLYCAFAQASQDARVAVAMCALVDALVALLVMEPMRARPEAERGAVSDEAPADGYSLTEAVVKGV